MVAALLRWFMQCQSTLILLHKMAFQPFWSDLTVLFWKLLITPDWDQKAKGMLHNTAIVWESMLFIAKILDFNQYVLGASFSRNFEIPALFASWPVGKRQKFWNSRKMKHLKLMDLWYNVFVIKNFSIYLLPHPVKNAETFLSKSISSNKLML